jgi:uncharacterized GH25 family protein
MYSKYKESADLTRMMEGHEIWLGDVRLDDGQAELALLYGDKMRPDGSPDLRRLSSVVYRPNSRTIKPSISSEKDRHILRFSCGGDGCYTVLVDLAPLVFTQTEDGWHSGPKSQFKNVLRSHVISQMAKRILPVGDGEPEHKEPPHGILEIVPKEIRAVNGGAADLRVFYEGRPLAGVEMSAVSEKMGSELVHTETDDQGGARIPLTVEGDWMFRAVHRDPAKKVQDEFDLATFVSTLVIEVH